MGSSASRLLRLAVVFVCLGSAFILAMCSSPRVEEVDPCSQVSILNKAIEQDKLDRAVEGIHRKKEALDDQLDDQILKLQLSPEHYRRFHEKDQRIDRAMAPFIAEQEARKQERLARKIKLLAEAEAACKAQGK